MTHVLRLTAAKYTAAVLVIALLIHVSSLTAADVLIVDLLNPEHPPSAPRAESHAPRS